MSGQSTHTQTQTAYVTSWCLVLSADNIVCAPPSTRSFAPWFSVSQPFVWFPKLTQPSSILASTHHIFTIRHSNRCHRCGLVVIKAQQDQHTQTHTTGTKDQQLCLATAETWAGPHSLRASHRPLYYLATRSLRFVYLTQSRSEAEKAWEKMLIWLEVSLHQSVLSTYMLMFHGL